MKYFIISLFFMCISVLNAENNYPFISHKSDEKILDYYLSPNGAKVVYAIEIDDGFKLTCIASKDCSKIWERDIYMDKENLLPLFKFITDDVFYAIDSTKHVYLNALDGKTTKSNPLFTDDIDDIVNFPEIVAVAEFMNHAYCKDSLMLIL